MRRIPRNPAKHDVFELFHVLAAKSGFSTVDENGTKEFINLISQSISKQKKNPVMFYGKQAESMFGYIAAALGNVKVIRQEDTGDIYSSNVDTQPPDYRLVLKDGYEFFAEIKNHFQRNPVKVFSMKKSYIQKLLNYTEQFKKDLKIAVYWTRWNFWTLLSLENFVQDKDTYSIEMGEALKYNQFYLLKDCMLGIPRPLIFRLLPDKTKPQSLDGGGILNFTIGGVELICGDAKIEDDFERRLAFYLLLYGNWPIQPPHPILNDGSLIAVDYNCAPEEIPQDQGFCIIGTLSSMMSTHYIEVTKRGNKGSAIKPDKDPAFLSFEIPEDYHGRQMPLWRFILQPPKS